jgi:AcrR family transcriptional regulator
MSLSPAERDASPAPATRDVIAQHARELFDQRGYAATSVRAIAAAAGIDPALVIRYFGSKEELFIRVMGLIEHPGPVLDGPTATLGVRLVTYALGPERADLRRYLTTLILASGYDRVRSALREMIGRLFIENLAQRLEGPDARLRARLIAAQIGGIIQGLTIIRDEDLTEADPNRVIELYGRAIQQLIDPPPA